MKELARTLIPRFALALLMSLGFAIACSVALGEEGAEPPGSDVFTSAREALLREKPSPQGRVVGRLPQGTRLTLVEARPTSLHVNGGWISREVAVVFAPDAGATRELVTVGRALSKTEAQRRLAAALLLRASERLREAKTPIRRSSCSRDRRGPRGRGSLPARASACSSSRRPARVGARAVRRRGVPARASSWSQGHEPGVRPRANARCRPAARAVPERSANLTTLTQESAAWLTLTETAVDPGVLRSSAERAGVASLALGRYLLALGKADEIARLQERVRFAGARVQTLVPGGTEGRRLNSRGVILRAMSGNGTATFPQEARMSGPVRERTVRIEGKLGALQLVVETRVGNARDVSVRKAAVPILRAGLAPDRAPTERPPRGWRSWVRPSWCR
jgi:hypothetical protein